MRSPLATIGIRNDGSHPQSASARIDLIIDDIDQAFVREPARLVGQADIHFDIRWFAGPTLNVPWRIFS